MNSYVIDYGSNTNYKYAHCKSLKSFLFSNKNIDTIEVTILTSKYDDCDKRPIDKLFSLADHFINNEIGNYELPFNCCQTFSRFLMVSDNSLQKYRTDADMITCDFCDIVTAISASYTPHFFFSLF